MLHSTRPVPSPSRGDQNEFLKVPRVQWNPHSQTILIYKHGMRTSVKASVGGVDNIEKHRLLQGDTSCRLVLDGSRTYITSSIAEPVRPPLHRIQQHESRQVFDLQLRTVPLTIMREYSWLDGLDDGAGGFRPLEFPPPAVYPLPPRPPLLPPPEPRKISLATWNRPG